MRQLGILTLIILLCPGLGAQQGGPAAPAAGESKAGPPELEARLAVATGDERLDLLIDLTEAYREDDPAKAIAFGGEALEILAATPDEDRELSLLNALGDAHLRRRE